MARIRTLKPDFFRSRSLARVSMAARLTFQGLWCEADDHGLGIADARLLKGSVWPLDDDIGPADVSEHLTDLARTGHIRLYEVEGESYYKILAWEKHQAAAYRRGEAVHPPPPAETSSCDMPHDQSCKKVRGARPGVLEVEGKGREKGTGKGEDLRATARQISTLPSPSFDDFYAAYPRKRSRAQAEKAWTAATKRVGPEEILAGVERLVNEHRSAEFTPYPASWLRAEGWKDEPEAPARSTNGRPTKVEESWRNIEAVFGPDLKEDE